MTSVVWLTSSALLNNICCILLCSKSRTKPIRHGWFHLKILNFLECLGLVQGDNAAYRAWCFTEASFWRRVYVHNCWPAPHLDIWGTWHSIHVLLGLRCYREVHPKCSFYLECHLWNNLIIGITVGHTIELIFMRKTYCGCTIFMNPQYWTSEVHVVCYTTSIELKIVCIWKASNLEEQGGYITWAWQV